MRKLKLQMQLAVDGFVAGPNGEMDWMSWNWDDRLKQNVAALTATIDTILLGRKLAEGFIPHWASIAAQPNNPEVEFGKLMHETHQVVFSKTMTKSPWPNAALANDDAAATIKVLKAKAGKDIIVYGGAEFVSYLVTHGLIDEYHLYVNPTAIGTGKTIFGGQVQKTSLKLISATGFECGVVALVYAKG